MKKFISVILCVCICLSSTVFCFASATQWDTSDQTNLSNIAKTLTTTGTSTLLHSVNSILTALTSTTQDGSLYNGVVYLYDIREYARQIASGLNGTNGSFLEKIFNALTHTEAGGIVYSYVTDIYQKVTQIDSRLQSIFTQVTNTASAATGIYAYSSSIDGTVSSLYTLDQLNGFEYFRNGTYVTLKSLGANGDESTSTINFSGYNWRSNLLGWVNYINNNLVRTSNIIAYKSKDSQTITDWNTLNSQSFTPYSMANGLYKYLSAIQTPIARLAYVLASDEEIEAREKAEENQTAVVDNFIDSSGSGAAAPSDFSSVSDLSSGFKDNIATEASVSGIWNIFNSDNFGWFSQETADQLDTSGSGTRTLRSSGSYPTPLLDQQTEDILKYIGGDEND